jgi:hypothetical protein
MLMAALFVGIVWPTSCELSWAYDEPAGSYRFIRRIIIVPTIALAVTVVLLARCRLPRTYPHDAQLDYSRIDITGSYRIEPSVRQEF